MLRLKTRKRDWTGAAAWAKWRGDFFSTMPMSYEPFAVRVPLFHQTVALFTAVVFFMATGCSTTRIPENATPLVRAEKNLKFARQRHIPTKQMAGYYLNAADDSLKVTGGPKEKAEALSIYNDSAAELTMRLRLDENGAFWGRSLIIPSSERNYRLRFASGNGGDLWPTSLFTGYFPSKITKERNTRKQFQRDGVGGALVGLRSPAKTEPFEPVRGFAAPVTATLDFSRGKTDEVVLALNNPIKRDRVKVNGMTSVLAADFTAPLLFQPHRDELIAGLMGLLRVGDILGNTGLFMLEPYDPDRTPVIFVHGLVSTPQMWLNDINELQADPVLRAHYQFWVFYYPTGTPMTYSAMRLREELARMDSIHPLRRGFVLIGHSLGGLLCRMQATDTGRVLWDRTFKNYADKLYARLPADNLVKRALIFSANPEVKRIVFICVPQRGSEMALGSIGALVTRLITLPVTLVSTVQKTLGDSFAIVLGINGGRIPTGIQSLSPKSATLQALDTLPIEAPYHSIIGDRGKKGNLKDSSDGVVPYWSSHLAGAQSELIVPGPHGSYEMPQTVTELRRILLLQLGRN